MTGIYYVFLVVFYYVISSSLGLWKPETSKNLKRSSSLKKKSRIQVPKRELKSDLQEIRSIVATMTPIVPRWELLSAQGTEAYLHIFEVNMHPSWHDGIHRGHDGREAQQGKL
jgi:hypothetical protein